MDEVIESGARGPSFGARMARSARASPLRDFLRAYVLDHGWMPKGGHEIPGKGSSTAFNVNFDQLTEQPEEGQEG